MGDRPERAPSCYGYFGKGSAACDLCAVVQECATWINQPEPGPEPHTVLEKQAPELSDEEKLVLRVRRKTAIKKWGPE